MKLSLRNSSHLINRTAVSIRFLTVALAVFCSGVALISYSQVTNPKVLSGHVPHVTSSLRPTGRLTATEVLRLTIGLPLHNEDDLHDLVHRLYQPGSSVYHHYLTTSQFTDQFGPTVDDYQTVSSFVSANNLRITGTYSNRLILDVEGTASDIENAFHVHLLTYQHPTEAREFYAPDSEPSVDQSMPILEIEGLSDYSRPQPSVHLHPDSLIPASGSGPNGYLVGNDFRNAYVPGVPLTGTGQIVGLLELDGYYASDITAYEHLAGRNPVTLEKVLVAGYGGGIQSQNGNIEVSLDIEMAIAMAPSLSKIVVFETYAKTNDWLDIWNTMATHTEINQFSTSWSYTGGPNAANDNILLEMAAQGQSVFVASGDFNADIDGETIPVPCDSPYSTSVGGTTLTMNGSGASYNSETVWNWGLVNGNYLGSSGGISSYYSIPPWQNGLATSGNQGSTTQRMIPDVALTADQVWVTYGNGLSNFVGGTSCAAPLWAAFTALVNQQGASNGVPSVGFVNPAIYSLGSGHMTTTYSSCFNDITTGNNEWPGSPSQFSAVSGYDLCTGWGTPAGQDLITYLTTPAPMYGPITISKFFGTNGASPVGFILSGGTFYGTTTWGGANSNGTIFSVEMNGSNFNVLHSLSIWPGGNDGYAPFSGPILSGGTLYGTAAAGGANGVGTVFSIQTNGANFNAICDFTNDLGGGQPWGGVVLSGSTLYGAAAAGGVNFEGSIFSVSTNGRSYKTLHTFNGNTDGSDPQTSLILSGSTLYGVTLTGGSVGFGTIFSIGTGGGSFKTLYNFTGGADGGFPNGPLLLHDGKLYGSTESYTGSASSDGTVFSISTSGSDFTTLHTFTGGSAGTGPNQPLILDTNMGTLLGTTYFGSVFSLSTNGANFTILFNFPPVLGTQQNPGPLILSGGIPYGLTESGAADQGTLFCLPPVYISDWWQAENNTYDSIGDVTGVPTSITYTTGESGYGFQFNGSSSSIDFGNGVGNFGTNDFAIDFWIQTTSASEQAVLSKNPSCSYANMWGVRLAANGTVVFTICADASGTDYTQLSSSAVVNDGAFHEIGIVRLGTQIFLNVDGVLNGQASTGSVVNIANSTSMMAGSEACTTGVGNFNGVLDEIKLYQSVR